MEERRAIRAFQEHCYPRLKAQIDEAAGFEVDVEVDWASLDVDAYAEHYEEALEKVYFQPLIDAFAALRLDASRPPLAQVLRRVVVCYETVASRVRFEQGVLVLDHYPVSDIGDVTTRAMAVVAALS